MNRNHFQHYIKIIAQHAREQPLQRRVMGKGQSPRHSTVINKTGREDWEIHNMDPISRSEPGLQIEQYTDKTTSEL